MGFLFTVVESLTVTPNWKDLQLWVCSLPLCWAKTHKQPLHWGWTQRGHLHFQPRRGRVLTASHTAAPREPTNQQRAHTASLAGSVKTCHNKLQTTVGWISALPVSLHWGANVENSKEAFHKCRHTALVREKKILKHGDTEHLNPSLWKPGTAVKGWGDEGLSSQRAIYNLTSQAGCLPVSQEGVWSDRSLSEVVWWRGGGTGNSIIWTQKTWDAGS